MSSAKRTTACSCSTSHLGHHSRCSLLWPPLGIPTPCYFSSLLSWLQLGSKIAHCISLLCSFMLGKVYPGNLPSLPLFSELSRTKVAETGMMSLSSGAGWWGVTFKKMCSSVLWSYCCHDGGKKSGPKKGPIIEMMRIHSRKRLLIKLIILVMVLEDQSHDFLAWENSRFFLKFEHSLLSWQQGHFLTGGSHINNQEWRRGTLKIVLLL